MTMGGIWQETAEHEQHILDAGYKLEVMWECKWEQLKDSYPDIQAFWTNSNSYRIWNCMKPSLGDALMPIPFCLTSALENGPFLYVISVHKLKPLKKNPLLTLQQTYQCPHTKKERNPDRNLVHARTPGSPCSGVHPPKSV